MGMGTFPSLFSVQVFLVVWFSEDGREGGGREKGGVSDPARSCAEREVGSCECP